MDNAYFIGYRIDLTDTDFDMWDMSKEFKKTFNVDYLPGEDWMVWTKADGGHSFLLMDEEFSDYRCPIDRSELWQDLHSRTFDFPLDGNKVFNIIKKSFLYESLVEKHGKDKVEVRWGIFLCLG